ncbi:uncharacterized protein LOC129748790 [Uranotaenia lowii]|uniref:uncharacterized protein LOC129748790 n=1 Tax=Uranotaenia lowii TaxID=190385 RepID=UPI00247A82D3|nr:uncharacterized protein LOC129748790 [Uranotaenia lowii]
MWAVLLISLLLSVNLSQSANYECSSDCPFHPTYWKGRCCISNLALLNPSEMNEFKIRPIHANHIVVTFANLTTKALTSKFLKHIKGLKHLHVVHGNVPSIQLSPNLLSLHVAGCGLEKLIINEQDSYKLQTLELQDPALTKLPTGINKLTHLTKLIISHTKIKMLNLSELQGLNELQELRIRYGFLDTIHTGQRLSLPNLRLFQLTGNLLSSLDVSNWDMPNMRRFDVTHNRLKKIDHLSTAFPELKIIRLWRNDWSCQWLREDGRKFLSRNVIDPSMVILPDEDCTGSLEAGICCDLPPGTFPQPEERFRHCAGDKGPNFVCSELTDGNVAKYQRMTPRAEILQALKLN